MRINLHILSVNSELSSKKECLQSNNGILVLDKSITKVYIYTETSYIILIPVNNEINIKNISNRDTVFFLPLKNDNYYNKSILQIIKNANKNANIPRNITNETTKMLYEVLLLKMDNNKIDTNLNPDMYNRFKLLMYTTRDVYINTNWADNLLSDFIYNYENSN